MIRRIWRAWGLLNEAAEELREAAQALSATAGRAAELAEEIEPLHHRFAAKDGDEQSRPQEED